MLLVVAYWGETGPNIADLNCDGIVDTEDLLMVFSDWGGCP